MHPVLLKIGHLQVYSYGAMLAITFLTVTLLAGRAAPSAGISKNDIFDLCTWLIVSGIIGGRVLFVLLNIDYYKNNPAQMLMVWQGGLVWYGGLIAAVASAAIFLLLKKIPLLKAGDLMAPYIALGQSIGRVGCFLNGCCFGKATDLPVGVTFDAACGRVHPTQLYESAVMLLVFLILRKITPGGGRRFFLYLAFYAVIRFFIEFLRGDNPAVFLGLTISQVMSVAILFIAVALNAKVKT